jgi:hypothetical protein
MLMMKATGSEIAYPSTRQPVRHSPAASSRAWFPSANETLYWLINHYDSVFSRLAYDFGTHV